MTSRVLLGPEVDGERVGHPLIRSSETRCISDLSSPLLSGGATPLGVVRGLFTVGDGRVRTRSGDWVRQDPSIHG